MGKHRGDAAAGGSSRLLIVALLGVVAIALIAFGLTSLLGGDDDAGTAGPGSDGTGAPVPTSGHGGHSGATDTPSTPPAADADPSTAPPPVAASTDEPTDPADEETTSPPDAAPTTSAPSGPPAALAGCAAQTEAGDAFVAATDQAADNWQLHYEASVQLGDGSMSLEEAQANWDRTREAGPADLEQYRAVTADLDDAGAACAALAESGATAGYDDRVTDCLTRAEALAEVRTRGDAMMADWEHHQEMMATKEEFDPEEYIVMWREDVAFAPERMDPYRAAATALEDAPACTT